MGRKKRSETLTPRNVWFDPDVWAKIPKNRNQFIVDAVSEKLERSNLAENGYTQAQEKISKIKEIVNQ